MYYRVEFFPIIASALLYGYSNGLKRAILAFFGGLFFSNVLPYKNFGHFTLEFDYSIIQALKPKVSSLTLSNVIDLENLNPDAFYGFFDTITSSQLLLIMFISYVFVGVFPGYVRDAVEKFGRFWLLLALLISSYEFSSSSTTSTLCPWLRTDCIQHSITHAFSDSCMVCLHNHLHPTSAERKLKKRG